MDSFGHLNQEFEEHKFQEEMMCINLDPNL